MRNLHKLISDEYGMEVLQLLRDWERLQIRDYNYKNHRIFTLRCIHKGSIPVSIKLKTTIRTEKARKIIRKAKMDLLQARVKSINSLLGYNAKQRDLCRSQLASILSITSMLECQEFIDKVSEFRYLKVKQRQINKFNRLLIKEGNIALSLAGSTLPLGSRARSAQAGSALSPAARASSPRQFGLLRQLELLPHN